MNQLFLAWQQSPTSADARQRAWFPIGRLERDSAGYQFVYTGGAQRAADEVGFRPLVAFPELRRSYRSEQLFSLFQNRVLNPSRLEYAELLKRLALPADDRDPIKILAVSGGERQTDNLEVFPRITTTAEGGFSCRFFAHGVRHLRSDFQQRIDQLAEGEALGVTLEATNPVTHVAIQLQTSDYQMVGWAPRYLIEDLIKAFSASQILKATVVRINASPAPVNQRLLVELSGRLTNGVMLMNGPDFQALV